MQTSGSIFLGVTTSPTREYVATAIKKQNPERVLMPCAGRFGAIEAMIGLGIERDKIWASDIGLYTSIVGYLADPRHSLSELGIQLPATLPPQPDTGDPDYDLAAQTMLAIGFHQISTKHQKGLNERSELLNNWPKFHAKIQKQVREMVDHIRGIHYDIADMWDVIREADATCAIFANIPTYKGGYTKMFEGTGITWNEPTIGQLDYSMYKSVVDTISASGALAIVGSHEKVHYLPEGWHVVFAQQVTSTLTDYLIASFDPGSVLASQKMGKGPSKHFPVYCDEEITENSKLQMVQVDGPTCLHYRDLFVHKLGATGAEEYYLMLIDGRVMTAFGLHTSDLRRFASDYLHVVFTISKSSTRYRRLVKLFELLLTSGEMGQTLLRMNEYGLREPLGMQTTNITSGPSSMISRGIMKFHSREPMPGGRFKVRYRTAFRTDTFNECLRKWLKKWGGVSGD